MTSMVTISAHTHGNKRIKVTPQFMTLEGEWKNQICSLSLSTDGQPSFTDSVYDTKRILIEEYE